MDNIKTEIRRNHITPSDLARKIFFSKIKQYNSRKEHCRHVVVFTYQAAQYAVVIDWDRYGWKYDFVIRVDTTQKPENAEADTPFPMFNNWGAKHPEKRFHAFVSAHT